MNVGKLHDKRARIRYHVKTDGRAGYAIEIYSEKKWELDMWFPLVAREGALRVSEDNLCFIHWKFLRALRELQDHGYKIDLMF